MKKIFLLIIFLLLVNIKSVKALSLLELKDNINNSIFNIKANIKDEKLEINDNDRILIFNYENNILSRSMTYDLSNYDSAKDLYVYLNIVKSVASLKGYSIKDIEYFLPNIYDAKMDKEGYEVIVNKKDNLIDITYEINLDTFNFDCNYLETEKPEIIIDYVSKGEVGLYVKASEKDNLVDLYRSKDNKNFEYVTSLYLTMGISPIYNSRVLENDTYYYKAVVAKSNNFSDTVNVDLKKTIDKAFEDEKGDNPLTGYQEFVGVSLLVIILIIGIINNINLRKKVYK